MKSQCDFSLVKIFIFICMMVGIVDVVGQNVNVSVVVLPPYTPYFEDYTNLEDKVIITLTNTSNQSMEVFLKGRLYNQDETFIAQTVEGYVPSNFITLLPNVPFIIQGNQQLFDFFSEENVELPNGFNFAGLANVGQLPEGQYYFCLGVYDKNDIAATTKLNGEDPLGCANFSVTYILAPQMICINQINKLDPQNINFNWIKPFSSNPTHIFKYDFYLVKIENENDNPQDLINAAIEENGMNVVKLSNINQNFVIYDQSKPILQEGNYVWAVVAKETSENYPISNNGLSQPCVIAYEAIAQPNVAGANPAAGGANPICSCTVPPPSNLNNINLSQLVAGTKVKTSNFEMEINTITSSGGLFSGTGYIPIPLLNNGYVKLNVNFVSIEIKSDGSNFYHTSGSIFATVNPAGAAMTPIVDPINPAGLMLGPSQVQNYDNYFSQFGNQLMSSIKNQANSIAYSIPIGIDNSIMNIAITKVAFNYDQAYFDAISVLKIIEGNANVGFVGEGICIDKNSFCGQAKIYLSSDVNISSIGIKLKGGKSGTLISFNKDGFDQLEIKAGYTFPAGTLVKVSDKKPLELNIESSTKKGWDDWMANVTFDPFHIDGFDDFKFSADNNISIQFDHSDVRNPEGIPSPYTMAGETPIATNLPTWQGLYMPSLMITLPPAFQTGSKQPIVARIEKLIFDGGLTGSVSIQNILSIGEGNIDSWYFSIDQFKLDLWKNSFKSSSLNGKIVLPISKNQTNASNQLNYQCTLTKPANQELAFNFSVTPKDQIGFDVLWAKANFIQGTEIRITKSGGQDFFAKAVLHGNMTFQTDIKDIPNIQLAEVKFQGMGVQTQSPYFVGSPVFSLGSPNHKVAGFSISIDKVSFDLQGANIGLKFDANLKLVNVDFAPKASVVFGVYGKIKFESGRPAWDGFDAKLYKIELSAGAKIGPVGVEGTIAYYNDQAGSYGFIGGLQMDIENVVKITAKAQFGYHKTGDFNYFFIDALADFGDPGLVMVPGVISLYGFGGGVFYNMTSNPGGMTSPGGGAKPTFNPNDVQAGKSLSGVIYTPSKGNFSINAKILFGYSVRSLLDADGTLGAEINALSGGLSRIDFKLRGRIINNPKLSLEERHEKSMGVADIDMRMNFQEGSFIFHAGINAGAPTYKDEWLFIIRAHLNFYAGDDGWFIHIGRPLPGKTVQVKVVNAFDFNSYFQAGNGSGQVFDGTIIESTNAVDPLPPIPPFIINILNRAKNGGSNRINSLNEIVRSPVTQPQGGFIFGVNFTKQFKGSFAIFYARAQFMAGFDVGFMKSTQPMYCRAAGGKTAMGTNGYYAYGQGYLGAEVEAGVHIEVGPFDERIVFAEAGVAAYITVGAPNPTFCEGELGGYYSVLGGLFEGGFRMPFTLGDKCETVISQEVSIISDVRPEVQFDSKDYNSRKKVQDDQEIYMRPSVALNFLIDKTFLIVSPDPNNQSKKIYRYYHIMPEDVICNIYKKGRPENSEFTRSNFQLASDKYSLHFDRNLLFEKTSEYYMDVSVKIKTCERNNDPAMNGKTSGYQDPIGGLNWTYAQADAGGDYVDRRKLEFKTNCGINKIQDQFIVHFNPMHRTQNVATVKEPRLNTKELKQATGLSYTLLNFFNPKSSDPEAIPYGLKTSNSYHELALHLNTNYLDQKFVCFPPGFEGNSDFYLKVNTFDKYADYKSKQSKYYIATVTAGKTLKVRLDDALPKSSYVVIQVILKKRSKASDKNSENFTSRFVQNVAYGDFKINKRELNTESVAAMRPDEVLFYEWYFTTSNFDTYRDKMKDLTVTRDTSNDVADLDATKYAGSGIEIHKYRVLVGKYKFYGNERFSFTDVENYKLNQILHEPGANRMYAPNLESGYLGFAFDNKAQELIDNFLKSYIDIKPEGKDLSTYLHLRGLEGQLVNDVLSMYAVNKMQDLCSWDRVGSYRLLPLLNGYPGSLIDYENQSSHKYFKYNSSHFKSNQKQGNELFALEKIDRIKSFFGKFRDGGNVKVNIKDFTPGYDEVINPTIINMTLDIMTAMNTSGLLNNLSKGFGPQMFNNKKF